MNFRPFNSLSARLLFLTIAFVMLSEVVIFVPSIARFRMDYLEAHIASARLASLALEVPPDNMVDEDLRDQLLQQAGSLGIVLRRPGLRALMLTRDMPPAVDQTIDVATTKMPEAIADALATLARHGHRILRVIGPSPRDPSTVVETVIDETPLREALLQYAGRIMAVSVLISIFTATLVFVTLRWLFVRPMREISESMTAFHRNPEDASRMITPRARRDEIGQAQRELAAMQESLRASLAQKTRLAALGAAVAKINHDLRGILATARLASDQLSGSADPKVRRIAPMLLGAIDRAVELCTQTLAFVQEGTPAPRRTEFDLRALATEVGAGVRGAVFRNEIARGFTVSADEEQLFRALANLVRNAAEAGASEVTVRAEAADDLSMIDVADNGPGLSERARKNLFQPFAGSAKSGGSGLGLAIAQEMLRAHGGDLELLVSEPGRTVFRLSLPAFVRERREKPAAE